MSLDKVTEAFRKRALEFGELSARVKFDLGDEGIVVVDAKTTPPAVSNDDEEVDCTIRLSLENLEKLLEGSLNPTLAYTLGKLKVEGSLGVAMKVASLLDE